MQYIMIALLTGLMVSGCATHKSAHEYGSDNLYGDALVADMPLNDIAGLPVDAVQTDQMMIWTGSITLEICNLTNASNVIAAETKAAGGYVESSSYDDGNDYYDAGAPSITLKLRIPSGKLEEVLDSLEGMGKVTAKNMSSEDITERYVDIQARLQTNKELRDRLKKLLDKAVDVKDVLAIEKEFNRIQADIDSMEARLKSMKGKVDYASLTVRIKVQQVEPIVVEEIPGPLGYVWKGTTWCVRKLFVWREAEVIEPEYSESNAATVEHIVYPGETLEDIARQYGVSVDSIRKLNKDSIREGQIILIPIAE
jgi:hypothetical protein